MKNPCIGCSMRMKIQAGCCVQGNYPDEIGGKTIVQKRNGNIVRQIEVCKNLEVSTGECLDYRNIPNLCSSFTGCERFN